jgi:hypothetical protein
MPPAATLTNPNEVKRTTRRFLEKTRDLEFGKKVSRLLGKTVHGKPALETHLQAMRDLFDCMFGSAHDPQVSAQRDHFLRVLETLRKEVRSRGAAGPNARKLDSRFVTALLKSHRALFEKASAASVPLRHCPGDLMVATTTAIAVWGNNI